MLEGLRMFGEGLLFGCLSDIMACMFLSHVVTSPLVMTTPDCMPPACVPRPSNPHTLTLRLPSC